MLVLAFRYLKVDMQFVNVRNYFFIYSDSKSSKSKYSNCFLLFNIGSSNYLVQIRSFAMFIFNNEVSITFIQALMDCCALQWLSKNIFYISANSYERLFGMSESRPVRPVQLTLFNKQDHHKPWGSKQKRPAGQQLPGKRKTIALELIFQKLRDKILTIEGSDWHLSLSLSPVKVKAC